MFRAEPRFAKDVAIADDREAELFANSGIEDEIVRRLRWVSVGSVTVGYPWGHVARLLQWTCSAARRVAMSRIMAILIMVSELQARRS